MQIIGWINDFNDLGSGSALRKCRTSCIPLISPLLIISPCRSGGMADAPDSKSGRGNPVRVQVPPPAPWISCQTDIFQFRSAKTQSLSETPHQGRLSVRLIVTMTFHSNRLASFVEFAYTRLPTEAVYVTKTPSTIECHAWHFLLRNSAVTIQMPGWSKVDTSKLGGSHGF